MQLDELASILEVPIRLLGISIANRGYINIAGTINDEIAQDLINMHNSYAAQLIEPIKTDNIPLSLRKRPVIYFLFDGDFVTYVGQSFNVLGRLGQHDAYKEYDGIYIVEVDSKDIDILELFYINKYNPRDNKTGKDKIDIIRQLVKKI